MLKPLTFSLSLAVALGLCSVSMAGGNDSSCTTCGLASPQGVAASPQGVVGCDTCSPPKHKICFSLPKLPHISLPKLKCSTSYEWVLKKKTTVSLVHGGGGHGHGNDGCGPVYATGQGGVAPSGQAGPAPTGQAHAYMPTGYAAPQVFGGGQRSFQAAKPAASIASVPNELTQPTIGGEEAPPAPSAPQNGGLLLPNGSGN
jgi:hypothetical protein